MGSLRQVLQSSGSSRRGWAQWGVEQLLGIVADPNDKRLPEVARVCIAALGTHLRVLNQIPVECCRSATAMHPFW